MASLVTGNIPKIGIAILALIVIGSLLFGPFSGMLEIISTDLQRILFGATYAQAALNSAKATAYATSCTALLNLDTGGDVNSEIVEAWNGPVSEDLPDYRCSATNKSQAARFGQVSVECDELDASGGGNCKIYGYELPQEPTKQGWGTWIAGMGHPEYLMYYEAFPHGPSSAWEVHGERLGAIAVASGAVLNLAFYGAAGRIASKADEMKSGVSAFLRNSDEGSSMMSSARKMVRAISPWRQFAPDGASAAKNVIAADITRSVRGAGANVDEITDGALREASENLYDYFQRNSLRERSVDDIASEVRNRLRGDGIDPGAIAGMNADEFQDISSAIALSLRQADEVRAGTATVNAGDDVAEWSTMRQFWLQKKATDDVMNGLFDGSGSFVRSKADNLISQAKDQVDDFTSLPEFALTDFSKETIKKRAMYLMCRSRLPRIVAHDGAEAYFQGNEEAEAIADALYVGSLSVDSICPGTGIGSARSTLRGWGSGAVKAFAGLAVASGYVAQKSLSDNQKHTPQGINSIVVKIPYVNPKVFKMHNMTNYYFMNLQKTDHFQSNSKNFYLVSPFTTRNVDTENPHIRIKKTQINCKKGGGDASQKVLAQAQWNNGNDARSDKDYLSTGDWKNNIHIKSPVDPNQPNTLSTNIISAEGNGIKTCATPPMVDVTFWDSDTYSVESLEFQIKNIGGWRTSDGDHNYGYDSSDLDAVGAKAAIVVLGIGLEFVSGPVPTTLILAGTGAAEVVIFSGIDKANAWPEH